ncbi:mucin-19-like [Anser cygnoides]|uniref:mucin-19-like n=1 Tax=Anser cygnoides TaxID=8845 RepID=UPI0034D2FA62
MAMSSLYIAGAAGSVLTHFVQGSCRHTRKLCRLEQDCGRAGQLLALRRASAADVEPRQPSASAAVPAAWLWRAEGPTEWLSRGCGHEERAGAVSSAEGSQCVAVPFLTTSFRTRRRVLRNAWRRAALLRGAAAASCSRTCQLRQRQTACAPSASTPSQRQPTWPGASTASAPPASGAGADRTTPAHSAGSQLSAWCAGCQKTVRSAGSARLPAAGGTEAEKGCAADPRSSATSRADGPPATAPQLAGEDLWGPTQHPGAAQLRGLQMAPPSRLVRAGLLGGGPHGVQGGAGPGLLLQSSSTSEWKHQESCTSSFSTSNKCPYTFLWFSFLLFFCSCSCFQNQRATSSKEDFPTLSPEWRKARGERLVVHTMIAFNASANTEGMSAVLFQSPASQHEPMAVQALWPARSLQVPRNCISCSCQECRPC